MCGFSSKEDLRRSFGGIHMKKSMKLMSLVLCASLILPVFSAPAVNAVSTAPLSVQAVSPRQINLSWPVRAGAKSYKVYRSDGGAFVALGSTSKLAYADKTVYPNITYTYRVVASNGAATPNRAATTPKKVYKDTDTAVFTNKFLEKWVRGKLGKSATAKITVKDLDRITSIRFADSTEITGSTSAQKSYYGEGGLGICVNGKNTISWDFYSLDDLMQFRRLNTLSIMAQQVTDISPLAGLSLVNLDLTTNHIADIHPLARTTTLQTLSLARNPVSDLAALSGLNQIYQLDLGGTRITNVAAVAKLPRLNDLELGFSFVKDLSALANSKNLNALILDGLQNPNLSFLPKAKTVNFISLSSIGAAQVSALRQSNVSDIEILFGSGSIPVLNLPKLTHLEIYHSSYASLSFLAGCANLQNLQLHNTAVTDLSAFAKLTKLTAFDTDNTPLTDVTVLGSLPKLKTLTLPVSAKTSYTANASAIRAKPGPYTDSNYVQYACPSLCQTSANPDPKPADFALQAPAYVPLNSVGSYDKTILTDALRNKTSSLPEASGSNIPYWTGTTTESKVSAVQGWEPVPYWTEQDVKFLADNKMDYLRALLSFTFLSDPDDPTKINLNAVREIDQLIAWGMKYNVHIELSMIGLPDEWGKTWDDENIGSTGGTVYFSSAAKQESVKAYWTMLAKRYAAISNKYLDFELYAEPNYFGAGAAGYARITVDLADAVWQAEGNKDKAQRRILFAEDVWPNDDSAKIAQAGVCIALHYSGCHRFMFINSLQGFYADYPYLPQDETWPVKYLPHYIQPGDALTIRSTSQFPAGTKISLYSMDGSDQADLRITAGGSVLLEQQGLKPWTYENNTTYSVTLKAPASQIQVGNAEGAGGILNYYQVTVDIPGHASIHLVPHDFGTALYQMNEKQPTITIAADGSVSDSQMLTSDYMYTSYVEPLYELAQKYGVGFMLGETSVGSDVDVKYAYQRRDDLLAPLFAHRIAWAADSFRDLIKPSRRNITVKNYAGTPWFYESEMIAQYKKYID